MDHNDSKIQIRKDVIPSGMRRSGGMPDGAEQIPLGSGIVTSLLGKGGMANVYEIWNSQLEVHHAVKLINPNCSKDSLERFQTEIKITAKLHHPNITEIYAVGKWDDLPYIEMEKLDGVSLDALICQRGALPVPVCTAIGIMVGRALKYAHNQEYVIYGKTYHGIVHRDLKPGNIMVCKDGVVKLMDFGIARPTEASFHTFDGSVIGTLQYLSPEQLNGEELDIRTDIYSLGTTLYEALTGKQAFPEKNVHKLVVDKSANKFVPLKEYALSVPPRLAKLIHKSMLYERSKRIADAGVFLAELDKIHRSVTSAFPEEVVQRYLNSPEEGKTVIPTRNMLPIRITVACLCIILAGFSFFKLVRYYLSEWKEQTAVLDPKQPPVIQEPVKSAPPPEVIAEQPEQKNVTGRRKVHQAETSPKKVSSKTEPASRKAEPERAPPKKTMSPIEKLQIRYADTELIDIMALELKNGNYSSAVTIYDHLSPGVQASQQALLYMLRALNKTGDRVRLAEFIDKTELNDAEFYLAAARLSYERKNIVKTKTLLEKSLKSPRLLMDYNKLKQEVSYYRALCSTYLFDKNPSEENWKAAIGEWHQVMSLLRSEPQHKYYQKAESERKRIGAKFRSRQG
ncbi:MAG: protein kinase [Chitinivibrionales bacterium]|nr:protein kinase [Chitinivibrionales bacterium]